MANHLRMATVHTILTLREQGWSFRRIGRKLGIHRETVARPARLAEAKPAKPAPRVETTAARSSGREGEPADPPVRPAGAEPDPLLGGEPTLSAPCSSGSSGPPNVCEPLREVIATKLESGLSAKRIHQDLVAEHAFGGSYDSVKRFCRRLTSTRSLPFRRMECDPGQEAQIDFGKGSPVISADGKRRRTHVLRVVLSHSPKAYSEVVIRQSTDDFIRGLENAFRHFGGVPKTLVPDNLKAAVLKPDAFDADVNPKLQAFATHYGTAIRFACSTDAWS